MTLTIESEKADRLARELAALTGETVAEAVTKALDERLQRARSRNARPLNVEELRRLIVEFRSLPTLDPRPADEILGYDERGLWR
jgi:antitoxin VapB